MKPFFVILSLLFLSIMMSAQTETPTSLHGFTMETITGEQTSLSEYEGKVVVVVNVASKCGLTPQYEDLQKFFEEYADKGVVILGFPANNFMSQEPGSNSDIQTFCTTNYGVTFPMFAKISVKGRDQHPLYQFLEEATDQNPTWNFHKYLINQQGEVVASISPHTGIYDESVVAQINGLLE